MTIPSIRDHRWHILLFLSVFTLFALTQPSFYKTFPQFLASLVTCITVDLLLLYILKRIFIFPLSAIVSTCGVFLLTESYEVWPFVLVAALSMFSKHVF